MPRFVVCVMLVQKKNNPKVAQSLKKVEQSVDIQKNVLILNFDKNRRISYFKSPDL